MARSSSPRSMATLLTSVETPVGGESCASAGAGGRAEVFSRESVTGRASGVSDAAMKGREKEAIGSDAGGEEDARTPGGRARFVLHHHQWSQTGVAATREEAGGLLWRSPYPYHKVQLRIPRSEVGVLRRPGLAFLQCYVSHRSQLLPRDHVSHSWSKAGPSNTDANPLLLNKSLMRCLGLAISISHFVLLACI